MVALPSNFGDLSYATQVSLDCFNHIGGELPSSLGQMKRVFVWTMADDPIEGAIPEEMCNLKESLQILHLGGAKLTGPIPDCLSFMADRDCGLSGNPFKCPIPKGAITGCKASCVP